MTVNAIAACGGCRIQCQVIGQADVAMQWFRRYVPQSQKINASPVPIAQNVGGVNPLFTGVNNALSMSSWECDNCNAVRAVTAGSAISVSAVPEPETYAMMLAGLGLLGFAARRRKQAQAV